MKKGVQKLWAELGKAQKPAKLSKQGKQVKLNTVQEAQTSFNELEDSLGDLTYFAYEVINDQEDKLGEIMDVIDNMIINSSMLYAKDSAESLLESLEKIEKSAKDLGVDPEDVFDQYEEAKDMADQAISAHEDLVSEWRSSRLQNVTAFADRIK
jgi:archaellum component FlaC